MNKQILIMLDLLGRIHPEDRQTQTMMGYRAARLRFLCKKVPRFLSGCMQLALRAKDSSRRERVRPSTCEGFHQDSCDFQPQSHGIWLSWIQKCEGWVRALASHSGRCFEGRWVRMCLECTGLGVKPCSGGSLESFQGVWRVSDRGWAGTLGWSTGNFDLFFCMSRIAMVAMPLVFCKGCHLQ